MELKQSEVPAPRARVRVVPGRKTRSRFLFSSIDSTPRGLSHTVPLWYGPALLATFCVLSVAMLAVLTRHPLLVEMFPSGDLVLGVHSGTHSIAVRVFVICYFLAYALFCHANPLKKIAMGLDLVVTFAFVCVSIDMATVVMDELLGVVLPLGAIEIVSGVLGFGIYSIKLLERGRMPPSIPMTINTRQNAQTLFRLSMILILSAWVAFYVQNLNLPIMESLRSVALLGGIGPGVFLFIPTFFLVLYAGGVADRISLRKRNFTPDISVVIPAHNEAHTVESTLRGIDAAAEKYAGRVFVIFVDNASTDDTAALATRIGADLRHAEVQVLLEPRPGKANALNTGLAAVKTDFMVRIDSDTVVRPNAFRRALVHFDQPDVGIVGGLPLPPMKGPFDRARFVEAVVKHGMYSIGLAAINGLVGVPGMFVVFRTALPRRLGGFVGGMNGEDTDMSLRIGELGYRMIVDPTVRYVSECPQTYAHMREQRMRWFRSTYHVTARCRSVVFSSKITLRGKVVLPYMLVNSARRAMMVPLILFGLIEYFGGFKPIDTLQLTAVFAVILGAPLITSAVAMILNGYIWQLIYLPEYIVFRVLRSYFTLESNLSINLKLRGENLYSDAHAEYLAGAPGKLGGTPDIERQTS